MPVTWEKDFRNTDPAKLSTLREMESAAGGLTMEEALSLRGLTEADLTEDDKHDVDLAFRRGRATAKKMAIDNLFQQMQNTRGGKEACMEYLSRFGEKWDEAPSGPTSFSMNFNSKK